MLSEIHMSMHTCLNTLFFNWTLVLVCGNINPLTLCLKYVWIRQVMYVEGLTLVSFTACGSLRTVQCLGVLTGAQLFSLNKEELRAVIPEEGTRVYSQLTVQKSLLEVRRDRDSQSILL